MHVALDESIPVPRHLRRARIRGIAQAGGSRKGQTKTVLEIPVGIVECDEGTCLDRGQSPGQFLCQVGQRRLRFVNVAVVGGRVFRIQTRQRFRDGPDPDLGILRIQSGMGVNISMAVMVVIVAVVVILIVTRVADHVPGCEDRSALHVQQFHGQGSLHQCGQRLGQPECHFRSHPDHQIALLQRAPAMVATRS